VAVDQRRLALVVPESAAGMRLDRFLGTLPELPTRSQAKQLIDGRHVRVEGTVRKAAHVLRAGARVEVELPAPSPPTVEPEALPLVVLYEDADLLAIDKPAGMVVHPAPGARRGTVVAALLHRLGAFAGVGDPERPGIVHRLDRDTSGVLLVARTPAALAALARQFHDRKVEKRYLAIVHGRVGRAEGRIERAVGRHPRERHRMSVHSRRGRPAVTAFTVLERFPHATLLALEPETGRTHQLRVHLAALGHPIVGDRVYGVRSAGRSSRGGTAGTIATFARQALHAESIRFVQPTTGAVVTVRSPLPADVAELVRTLREHATESRDGRGFA
jgi:23S rRNA pseudouridine1911/1915/1917 synthase